MNFWDNDFSSEIKEISDHMSSQFYVNKLKDIDLDMVNEDLYIEAVIIQSWEHFKYLYQYRRSDLKNFTTFNQKHLSSRASPSLTLLQEDKNYFLALLLRLIHEFYFWEPSRDELPAIINTAVLFRLESLTKGSRINSQFLWIAHSMFTSITRDLITSNEFQSIRKISEDVDQFENKISTLKNSALTDFEQEIDSHKSQIGSLIETIENLEVDLENYEKKLSEYKNEYNFILLSKAFKKMSTAKNKELTSAKIITWVFITLLSGPPLFTFLNHIFSWIDIGSGLNSLTFYLPLLTLELLIFYFMRLYYGEVKTLNTQLLQIEHRLSLCEFVHDYIDKKNADKDNKSSWDAFEALIFSPIQVSAENIPSLLDGANAVADIAGKVMSKSKS